MKPSIAHEAQALKDTTDRLDDLLDSMTQREAQSLLEVYKSINVILKAQECLIKDKPSLKLIKE